MAKIDYTNKVDSITRSVPNINKVTASDMNQIKEAVNVNVDDIALKADLNGNNSEIFKVSSAVSSDDAVTKAQLDASVTSDVTAQNTSLVTTNLVVAPENNLQDFADKIDHAVLIARSTGVDSSYVSTVSVGGTTFSVPALNAEINGDEGYFHIDFTGATNVEINTLTATSTYVYIDKNNTIQQQTTKPTREDLVRKVFVMRISVDASSQTIINFEYFNNPIGHYSNSIRDIYAYLRAAGVPFKIDMNVTGRTDNLGFDIESGSFLEFGGTGNIYNPSSKEFNSSTNVDYTLVTRTNRDAGGNTNLVKFWDNNATITALGSTTCVAHRLYRDSFGDFFIQYGQGNYANMTLARAGSKLEEYVLNPVLKDSVFLGWWLIESTATVTAGTVLAEFVEYTIGIQGGTSSALSGAFLIGNNFSEVLDGSIARANLGVTTLLNLKADDDEVVKLTGAQTVVGSKTFSDDATFEGNVEIDKSPAGLPSTTYSTTVSNSALQISAIEVPFFSHLLMGIGDASSTWIQSQHGNGSPLELKINPLGGKTSFGGDVDVNGSISCNTTVGNGYQIAVGTKASSGNLYSIYAEGRIFTPDDVGADTVTVQNAITANQFVKDNGTSNQYLKADGSVSAGYKVYTALITQSGTSAPTSVILENTLGGVPSWIREGSGTYSATLNGTFTDNKTVLFVTNKTSTYTIGILQFSANRVIITTGSDDVLEDTTLEIRVYD